MVKPAPDPQKISEAHAMRAAGYSALAISQRLGISTRTLQRHFAANGTVKGAAKTALYDRAVADLLASITSETSLKEEAARQLADDLAHARHIRELMHAASTMMTAKNLTDAALVMRAAAAYSTAIKNTSDIVRQSLRLDRFRDDLGEEMPELVVSELTQDDIAAMRAGHRLQDEQDGRDLNTTTLDQDQVMATGEGAALDVDCEVVEEG
jgi:AraC-like DNA-binding protein